MKKATFVIFYLLAVFFGNIVGAEDVNNLTTAIHFVGRWDFSKPDKALTVNAGSYLQAQFSGSSVNALFDVTLNRPPMPTIAWRIDDGDWHEAEMAAKVSLAQGLAAGSHTVMLMVRGIYQGQNRWTAPLIGSVTFSGLEFPDGGGPLPPLDEWNNPKLKIEFLGDSITEGAGVHPSSLGQTGPAWDVDALDSWPCRTALLLNAAWRQVGFSSTGLLKGGGGGVPGALITLNLLHDHCPRDNWQPDLVVVNQGTNDAKMPATRYELLYQAYLSMIREAYPNAKIAALRPFVGSQAAGIQQAVNAARTAGDTQVYYIDTTGWYSSKPLHPQVQASLAIAAKLAVALKSQVLGG